MGFDPIQHDDPVAFIEQQHENAYHNAGLFRIIMAAVMASVLVSIFFVRDCLKRIFKK